MGRLNKKLKIIINIVAVVILLAGVLTSLMYSILITGAKNMDSDSKKLVSGSNSDSESVETAVVYNRNTYAYKKGLINILVLGIDGEGNLYDGHTAGNMGQSNAIYLLSIDTINKKISVIGIPRDTMTSVRFFDQDGSLTTVNTAQIAVQYAFGSDIDDSLNLTANAVSKLLYNVSIDRVMALSINSIGIINDAIGGVDVTIENDFTDESGEILEESFIKGNTVHLEGDSARIFVQERDCNIAGSAMDRLSRQEQYFEKFIPKAKKAVKRNVFLGIDICNKLDKKGMMYTDMSMSEIAYVISEVLKCDFSFDEIKTISGKIKYGKQYEEYHVDFEKLRQMVMDTFYEKIK